MLKSRFVKLVMCSVLFATGQLWVAGQDMPPPEGGEGAPYDNSQPPQKPEKPIKPEPVLPLELDMGWLELREQLLAISEGQQILGIQFKDANSGRMQSDNPFVQQLREYCSEKYIVSEWARERPLGFDWNYPVPSTKESIAEIEKRLLDRLELEAKKKYPNKTAEEHLADAKKKYTMCKRGQSVSFSLVRGNSAPVTGRIIEMTNNHIMLSPRRFVSRHDMSDETAAYFFKDINEKVIKKYVDTAMKSSEAGRRNYISVELNKHLPQELAKSNYVPNHITYAEQVNTRTLFKKEHWIARRDLVRLQQSILWQRNFTGDQSLGTRMRNEFMSQMGFMMLNKDQSVKLGSALRADEENRYLGWVPARDVAMMKKWLERKKQYDEDIKTYDERMRQYQIDLKRYEEWQKAHPQGSGEEEEEE